MAQLPQNGSINETPVSTVLLGVERLGQDARVWFETEYGMGEVLFHKGQMTKARLGGARGQTALLRLLGISEGRFGFEPCTVPEASPIISNVEGLLELHSVRQKQWKELCSQAPPLSSVLRLTPGGAEVRDAARGIQRVVLVLIDGRRTLMQVLEESSFDPVEALQLVVKALYDDLAQVAPQANSLFPLSAPGDASGVLPRFTSALMESKQESASMAADLSPATWRHATLVGIGSKSQNTKESLVSSLATPIIDVGSQSSIHGQGRGYGKAPEVDSLVKTVIQRFGYDAEKRGRDVSSADAPRQRIVDVTAKPTDSLVSAARADDTSQSGEMASMGPFATADGQRRYVGRYEVLLRIGRGGMGTVYLARLSSEDVGFRRLYALKLLRNHLSQDAQTAKDFLDEARVAGLLHHTNVVGVYDAGFHGRQPYLVMEYVEGCSFRQLMRALPQRSSNLVIPIILDTLAGLYAAHTLQDESGRNLALVHCDVSPENMLVGVDGTCRLSDFGMARRANRAPGETARGRPGYIAPERIAGKQFDHRADIFSVGAVLWGALTGKRLFNGDTVEATIEQVCNKPIDPPSACGASSSPALDAVVLRALSRDPDERFQTADEMLTELARVARKYQGLATTKEIASWVRDATGPELAQRRLAILDASRNNPTIPPPAAELETGVAVVPNVTVSSPQRFESTDPPAPRVESKPSESSLEMTSGPMSSMTDVAALFYDRNGLGDRSAIDTRAIAPRASDPGKAKASTIGSSKRKAWVLVALLFVVVCAILLALTSKAATVSGSEDLESTSPSRAGQSNIG